MSYTSKYAQDEMAKAIEPKKKSKKSGKVKKYQDPKYTSAMKKKKAEKLASMNPNNPNY